jgi:predicted AlkP superfamily phosphohydrolase/phosphomutase
MSGNKRLFVLGIDGVPHSLIQRKFGDGSLKNLRSISESGTSRRMNSVFPTISSVAWTTYSTGLNPAEHSIFGFVDRKPNPFSMFIPLSKDRKSESLWRNLSLQGKRVIVINVPLTYPPEEVNGIVASGFLCTALDKLCYPGEYNDYFESKGYVIDVDAWIARDDKRKFMDELFRALEKRFEIAFDLMSREEWDFFQLHVMETDRLLHFFWEDVESGGDFGGDAEKFFSLLDSYIGRLRERLNDNDRLLILSDHGFCSVKSEVELNMWLEQEGLLKMDAGAERKLQNYSRDTVCYSLLPGRIYINLEGREERGSVPQKKYDKMRKSVKDRLLEMRHPETGDRIIDRVFFREEIYAGPHITMAPDIIAHPVDGYDLKGRLDGEVFQKTVLNGMHTYDDAFICSDGINVSDVQSIEEVRAKILHHFIEN